MTETTKHPPEAVASAAPSRDDAADAFAQGTPTKPKRTLGLWLVDTLIYPIVNNFGVFSISVFATYLTQHGWPKPASGKALAGWKHSTGEFFKARGVWLDNAFKNTFNASQKTAEMARMVVFSFVDGTFVAPFVKVLEDRREKMAMAIDSTLGTKPKDESVYEAEPKQSWRSVIEGRLLTSLIVVPTAVLLNKKNVAGQSLNDFLFHNPGEKRGEQIERSMPKLKAGIEKLFGKVHLPFFAKTIYFEAFYTSVCTAGLYLISRTVARKHPKKEKPHHAHTPAASTGTADSAPADAEPTISAAAAPEKPSAKITRPETRERMAERALEPELTA